MKLAYIRGYSYHTAMQKYKNKIICGDCIELLAKVKEPFADLIFADPPFNIGYKYDKYKDKVKSKNISPGRATGWKLASVY